MKRLTDLIRLLGVTLLVMAIITELRKPAEERTWQGCLLDFIPYDLRIPTPGRVQAAWWNPGSTRILTPTPFGIGWTINFGALWQILN